MSAPLYQKRSQKIDLQSVSQSVSGGKNLIIVAKQPGLSVAEWGVESWSVSDRILININLA